ncbi:MAG: PGPGW domain-containing protein [Porticoccaceae bacterium]
MNKFHSAALNWVAGHSNLLTTIGFISAIVFVASLASLPWLAAAIDEDYFCSTRQQKIRRHPLLRLARNLTGGLLLLCGIVMLVLPGQGILTILVALVLMDYPGKTVLEQYIVSIPSVLKSLNWLRRRRGAPPLKLKK